MLRDKTIRQQDYQRRQVLGTDILLHLYDANLINETAIPVDVRVMMEVWKNLTPGRRYRSKIEAVLKLIPLLERIPASNSTERCSSSLYAEIASDASGGVNLLIGGYVVIYPILKGPKKGTWSYRRTIAGDKLLMTYQNSIITTI